MGDDENMNREENPGYVTKDFCDERFNRVIDTLTHTNKKLDKLIDSKEEESHAFRNAVIAVLSGVVTALVTWFLSSGA